MNSHSKRSAVSRARPVCECVTHLLSSLYACLRDLQRSLGSSPLLIGDEHCRRHLVPPLEQLAYLRHHADGVLEEREQRRRLTAGLHRRNEADALREGQEVSEVKAEEILRVCDATRLQGLIYSRVSVHTDSTTRVTSQQRRAGQASASNLMIIASSHLHSH
jgi:hypothetical protein